MEVVIDTNVFISGLLKPHSTPGEILDMIFSGQIVPVFDDRILTEYEDVMRRKKFGFPGKIVDGLLLSMQTLGKLVVPEHTDIKLPDEYDRCFYECARSSITKVLVTGNKKHFPKRVCSGIKVFLPREFLGYFFREG